MFLNGSEEARLAIERSTPVSYWTGGRKYIGKLTAERGDGKFHFIGVQEGRSEQLTGWDDPRRFRIIEQVEGGSYVLG